MPDRLTEPSSDGKKPRRAPANPAARAGGAGPSTRRKTGSSKIEAPTAEAGPGQGPERKRREYLRADERKRQIISAVQDVFARNNLQGASTRELAKAADVNIATIFNLFGSKEELFIASVVQPMLEIMRDSDRELHIEDAQSSGEMRDMLVPWMARTSQSMIDNFSLLTSALFSDEDIGRKLYCDHIYPLIEERADRIGPWFKEGANPELRCLAGFGIWFAIAMDRFFRGSQHSLADLVNEVRDIVFADLRDQPTTRDWRAASSGKKGSAKTSKRSKASSRSKRRPD